jgi:hypothetical protein
MHPTLLSPARSTSPARQPVQQLVECGPVLQRAAVRGGPAEEGTQLLTIQPPRGPGFVGLHPLGEPADVLLLLDTFGHSIPFPLDTNRTSAARQRETGGHLVASFDQTRDLEERLVDFVAPEQFCLALGDEGIRIYWSHHLRLQALQWQEGRLPGQILWLTHLHNKLQVTDTIADRYAELVRVDNATKRLPLPLALRRYGEQIVILGEEHPFQLRRAVQ